MFRANVTPSFTQDPSDVTDVPQTQAFARRPEGFAALGSRQAGHPEALRICTRHMRHQVFDGFILDRFPCPSNGKHKAPAPRGIIHIALKDHLPILLGAIGCITRHNNPLGPRRSNPANTCFTSMHH